MARTHTQNAVSSLASYFFYENSNAIRTSNTNKFCSIIDYYVNSKRNRLNTFSFMKLKIFHRHDVNRMVHMMARCFMFNMVKHFFFKYSPFSFYCAGVWSGQQDL